MCTSHMTTQPQNIELHIDTLADFLGQPAKRFIKQLHAKHNKTKAIIQIDYERYAKPTRFSGYVEYWDIGLIDFNEGKFVVTRKSDSTRYVVYLKGRNTWFQIEADLNLLLIKNFCMQLQAIILQHKTNLLIKAVRSS